MLRPYRTRADEELEGGEEEGGEGLCEWTGEDRPFR